MKHNDIIDVSIPPNTNVTISEELPAGGNYTASFKLDDEESVKTNNMTFEVVDDTYLCVTNTSEEIPTGIWISYTFYIFAGAAVLSLLFFFRRRAKRYKSEE